MQCLRKNLRRIPNMTDKIKKQFLQEHFRKNDTLTLYKPDGTPVTFSKKLHIRLYGGHCELIFEDYDKFLAFCADKRLRRKPVPITVI